MITAGHRNHGRTWKVLDTDLKSLGLGGAAGLGAGAALCGSCCGVDTYSSVQKVQGSPGEKSRLRRHSAHKNAERSTLLRSRAVWESGRTCKCLRGHDTPASLSDAPVDWPAEQAWPRYTLAGCAATAGAGDRPRVAESPSSSFSPSRGMATPRLGDIWPTLTLAGCATIRGGARGAIGDAGGGLKIKGHPKRFGKRATSPIQVASSFPERSRVESCGHVSYHHPHHLPHDGPHLPACSSIPSPQPPPPPLYAPLTAPSVRPNRSPLHTNALPTPT